MQEDGDDIQRQIPRLITQSGIMYLRQNDDDRLVLGLDINNNLKEGAEPQHPDDLLHHNYIPDELVTPCQGLLPRTLPLQSIDANNFTSILAHATHPMLRRDLHHHHSSQSSRGSQLDGCGSVGSDGGGVLDSSIGGSSSMAPAPGFRSSRLGGDLSSFASHITSDAEEDSTSDRDTTGGGAANGSYPNSLYSGHEAPRQPSSTGSSSITKKVQYHKTKLCPWHRDGKCFMGAGCNYAHSQEELRPKPDLSKTKLCPEFLKSRQCDRPGCRFAHAFVELRATSTFFKTRICKYWQRGHCPAGDECRHAHGREDLRVDPASVAAASSSAGMQTGTSSDEEVVSDYGKHARPTLRTSNIASCVGPSASTLPSPSFMSTSASTPLPPPSQINSKLVECAESLVAEGIGGQKLANIMNRLGAVLNDDGSKQQKVAPQPGQLPTKVFWENNNKLCDLMTTEEDNKAALLSPPPTEQRLLNEGELLLPQFVVQGLKGMSPSSPMGGGWSPSGDPLTPSFTLQSAIHWLGEVNTTQAKEVIQVLLGQQQQQP